MLLLPREINFMGFVEVCHFADGTADVAVSGAAVGHQTYLALRRESHRRLAPLKLWQSLSPVVMGLEAHTDDESTYRLEGSVSYTPGMRGGRIYC